MSDGSSSGPLAPGDEGVPIVQLSLVDLPEAEVDVFLAGMVQGYVDGEAVGYARGYQQAQAEMAVLQRRAARIVHLNAALPEYATRPYK